jgi:hypothetical protein
MNRRPTRLAVAALTACVVAALPAGASAATKHHAPSKRAVTVAQHLKASQKASKKVASLTRHGKSAAARRALRTARHEATVASRQARSLAVRAQSDPATAPQAVWSLAATAGQLGDLNELFATLIPRAGSMLQQALATAIPGGIAGRDALVQQLTTLVQQLTGDAQALAAKALAAVQAGSPDQVAAIAHTATIDNLPASIASIIDTALSAATSALDTGLSVLTGVLPSLPGEVQGPIATALQAVQSAIAGILPIVQSTTQSVVGAVQSVLDMVSGLLGNLPFVGGILGGGTSSDSGGSGTSGGLLGGGLLSGLTNLIPGFGNLFGNLLGGLTGAHS